MNIEKFKKLKQDFPDLFPEDKSRPIGRYGIECEDGWYNLIYSLCAEMIRCKDVENIQFFQIKEKFATLRVYMTDYNEKLLTIISKYEKLSETICEYCGTDKNVTRGPIKHGWLKTACDSCRMKE